MTEQRPKLIARDEETQRVIIGIGQQRIAFDLTTRITHLPPNAGDKPAAVLSMKPRPDPGNQSGTSEDGLSQKTRRKLHSRNKKRRKR